MATVEEPATESLVVFDLGITQLLVTTITEHLLALGALLPTAAVEDPATESLLQPTVVFDSGII